MDASAICVLYIVLYLCLSPYAESFEQADVAQECNCSSLREHRRRLETKVQLIQDILIYPDAEYIPDTLPLPCPFEVDMCHDTEMVNCLGLIHTSSYDTLDASGDPEGSWPDAGICRVVYIPTVLPLPRYDFAVELYSENIGSAEQGHPGLVFNVINQHDFDFVFFRTNTSLDEPCIQHGHVTRGTHYLTCSVNCTQNPISQESYFQTKIMVANQYVNVYVNSNLVAEFETYHMSQSRVGIMALNGYGNKIRFRNIAWQQTVHNESVYGN